MFEIFFKKKYDVYRCIIRIFLMLTLYTENEQDETIDVDKKMC